MNLLWQSLLSNAAIVAVLAIAVYAVTRVWRNPQLAHALWTLLLLKLVTPPFVNLPLPVCFSAADSGGPAGAAANTIQAVPPGVEQNLRSEPSPGSIEDGHLAVTSRTQSFVVAPPPESPGWLRLGDWRAGLVFAWGAGSLLIAAMAIMRVCRFARLVAATVFASEEIQREADELARQLGMHRSPLVRIVLGAIPPVVWSIGFRTEILLPGALLANLGREERRTILVHELAHVVRRDHWVRWLEAVVVALYWWNPIVWLVRRELNVAEEQCCDAWVVWLVPENRRTYAGALLLTVEFLSAARARLPLAASGMARSFPLRTRMAAILTRSQGHRLSWPLRLSVVAAALVGLPLSAVPSATVALPRVGQAAMEAGTVADSRSATAPAIAATEVAAVEGDNTLGAAVTLSSDKDVKDAWPAWQGRLFARGFWWRSDRIQGKMAIASIDPATGDWQPLVEDSDDFSVTPDGQTIFYSREGALWNGDARKNENPGKVFAESGNVVFAPDSKSMLVTTWKRKEDKPDQYETTVWKMGVDGTGAVPIVALSAWGNIRDWSPDGKWLLVAKNRSIHLVGPDGKESRLLLKLGDDVQFSPDGKRVVYSIGWTGKIRVIDVDGSNDRAVVELPQLIYANQPHWSPDGKHLASVLLDLKPGNDGVTPVLYADPGETHPRIAIFDAATGEQRTLTLPRQNDWDFFPTGEMEWR